MRCARACSTLDATWDAGCATPVVTLIRGCTSPVALIVTAMYWTWAAPADERSVPATGGVAGARSDISTVQPAPRSPWPRLPGTRWVGVEASVGMTNLLLLVSWASMSW